jgi:DUF971 family protein
MAPVRASPVPSCAPRAAAPLAKACAVQPLAGTAISQLQPVGDMGLQIVFNDGHDRGIYPWPYLHQLSTP